MIKKIQRKWLPFSLEALAPWFVNFTMKFDEYHTTLGFVAADLATVGNDNAVVLWLAESQAVAEANLDGFRKFRDETLYNIGGSPTPVLPPTALPAPPAALATEIIERLIHLVDRIQMANGYTESIGAALGIVASEGSGAPKTIKPTIQLFAAASNYETAVVVANRADSDMFNVQARTMTSDAWKTVKSGTGKSINVTLTPTVPGQSEKFLVRVQLLKKNDPYGQPSDPAYVTVSP
jgi:hypothetical protein